MSIEYRIGDVRDRLTEIPDGSIDLIVTSPPFLALRSYLPDDHPDKHREIGAETTPAAFIDTLLHLTQQFGRVLTPHGSICVELGDTYSGSGGAGGDYSNEHGMRTGQQKFRQNNSSGWPLNKSLTGIPTLYTWSLAYGRNLLTGEPSPAGQWRIRNVIVWARPNPPVGALGDKFRPATSYITVACRNPKRYFDLDAVRSEPVDGNPGAPPLDWHDDMPDEDGDWLWKMATQPYKGSHYAAFPLSLPKRMIEAMCPLRVCTTCGKPSERIVEHHREMVGDINPDWKKARSAISKGGDMAQSYDISRTTLGWTDCGHNTWRTGIVLDPFAGSGTTLDAAQGVGRHAIGIDFDERNADLAQERVGMFLQVIS